MVTITTREIATVDAAEKASGVLVTTPSFASMVGDSRSQQDWGW